LVAIGILEWKPMSRRKKDPMRPLTEEEQHWLERLSRAGSAPASQVARAKALLAVAAGHTYSEAAALAGRHSGDAVAMLVARFNREGRSAVALRHGGGPSLKYGEAERARILLEFARTPDREQDGTATWSVATLQRALQKAEDGLPVVSLDTVWRVLREHGLSWQQSRSWCNTGTVLRKRKRGVVTAVDPDLEQKKS
jgi:transposase